MQGKLRPRSHAVHPPTPRKGARRSKQTARRGSKTVLVLPDIHCGPDFDPAAVDCAVKIAGYYKPQEIVVLGDMLDCHLFSAHPAKSITDAKIADFFDSEVSPANRILDKLQAVTDKLVFVEGNHENRILRAAAQSKILTQLFPAIRPDVLLGFDGTRDGAEYIGYDGPLPHYKITERLIAIHGWSVSKNFAKSHYDMLGGSVSVVCGHVHRSQTYQGRHPLTGDRVVSWSPGCLSSLQPSYTYHNPTMWTQGVTLIKASNRTGKFCKFDIQIDDGVADLPDDMRVTGRANARWLKAP